MSEKTWNPWHNVCTINGWSCWLVNSKSVFNLSLLSMATSTMANVSQGSNLRFFSLSIKLLYSIIVCGFTLCIFLLYIVVAMRTMWVFCTIHSFSIFSSCLCKCYSNILFHIQFLQFSFFFTNIHRNFLYYKIILMFFFAQIQMLNRQVVKSRTATIKVLHYVQFDLKDSNVVLYIICNHFSLWCYYKACLSVLLYYHTKNSLLSYLRKGTLMLQTLLKRTSILETNMAFIY